jgi:WhiB family transcriptional regulator, redox-sensing transcriptional regulator
MPDSRDQDTPSTLNERVHWIAEGVQIGRRLRSQIGRAAATPEALAALLGQDDDGDRSWRDDAACTDVDPELFYPEVGESPDPALATCAGCPVRTICLELALTNYEGEGIWGGTTPFQRRRIRERRRKRAAQLAQQATTADGVPA